MRTLAIVESVALLAVGVATSARAGECIGSHDTAALRCAWDFHGDYTVKGFDIYYGTAMDGLREGYPRRGESCLQALDYLQSGEWFRIKESAGNALTDTYLLSRCGDDLMY